MDGINGANDEFLSEIEALLGNESQQETPPAGSENSAENEGNGSSEESGTGSEQKPEPENQTKAFAKRLKESTEKARLEEREAIAKSLGYSTYDEMIKDRQDSAIRDEGLDPEKVTPIVEKLVQERLDNDPRMKELSEFRKRESANFAKRELEEISKLTDGKITRFDQLSVDVINLWKQKGSLKSAYLELKGAELIDSIRAGQSKGTTEHMANVGGSPSSDLGMRHLTDEEKSNWRFFNPSITEDELNKKLVKKEG